MKRMMATSVLGVMSCVSAAAVGGGIDPSWVDAEAGWVMHIDVEGMVQSELGSAVLEFVGMEDDQISFEELVDMLKNGADDEDLGLAVMREIRDVTVIGLDDDEPDLVVARTSGVVHAMIEAMQEEGEFEMIEKDGHSIVSFDDGDGYAVVLPTQDEATYRVVVGQTVDKLVNSIAAAHTRRAGPAWADGAAGKLVFMHIEKPAEMAGDDLPVFLQDAGEIEFSLGEQNGMLDASLIVETGDEDAAMNLVGMAHGLLAFGRMAAAEEPELADMLSLTKGLGIRADGTAVLANLSIEVDSLVETMRPIIEMDDDEVSVKLDVDTEKYE